MSTPKPRKKKVHENPFVIPENCSALQLNADEKAERQEERRRFLTLPVSEKTYQTTRMMSTLKKELLKELNEEEGEDQELMKTRRQGKNKKALPVQTAARQMLKMDMMKHSFIRESRHDLISLERQNAVLELSLMEKRAEIQKMEKVIGDEEKQLKELEKIIEKDNLQFKEILKENEKKSLEAKIYFEQQAKSKQDKNAEIRKLSSKIGALQSELEDCEQTLSDYRRYKELLFKLSPPEWQEAQRAKMDDSVSNCGQGRTDRSEEDVEIDPENKIHQRGSELPAIRESSQASTNSTRIQDSPAGIDGSEFEDEPDLYFTDPQQLVDVVTEMTEQIPSLIQNTTRVEEILEDLRQATDSTRKKIEMEEEQLTSQINDMQQKIRKEKLRAAKLKKKVELHNSLSTDDQDHVLAALGEKVTEVHSVCVDNRSTGLSTLEKLANIEKYVTSLLQSLESIPEERLDMMRKIKESEKRIRQREEKLMEQKRKQKERMERYLERSLADVKRTSGRKLMPRCIPVSQTVKVTKEETHPTEDEINTYLYSADDLQ
ncbi:cilia- and flagella-associated protein 100 [Neosynchiropus ocellatus]